MDTSECGLTADDFGDAHDGRLAAMSFMVFNPLVDTLGSPHLEQRGLVACR